MGIWPKLKLLGCVGLRVSDFARVCHMCLCVCVLSQLALLNPIENPELELAIVMLIVPFFVNVSLLFEQILGAPLKLYH